MTNEQSDKLKTILSNHLKEMGLDAVVLVVKKDTEIRVIGMSQQDILSKTWIKYLANCVKTGQDLWNTMCGEMVNFENN